MVMTKDFAQRSKQKDVEAFVGNFDGGMEIVVCSVTAD